MTEKQTFMKKKLEQKETYERYTDSGSFCVDLSFRFPFSKHVRTAGAKFVLVLHWHKGFPGCIDNLVVLASHQEQNEIDLCCTSYARILLPDNSQFRVS